ncbi:MAG: chemotaxis protein MotA [Bacteroidota bacterium]|nr:chemotaxis protein MotA [Bacteroidota bacterium]
MTNLHFFIFNKINMKSSTLVGIIIGIAAIFSAFLIEGGSVETLFMAPAMVIVFGGTFAAGLAGTSFANFKRIPVLLKIAFFPVKQNFEEIINQIVYLSTIARMHGVLVVEQNLDKIKNPFLKKLFQVAIDGADVETLQQVAEAEMRFASERHNAGIMLFQKMGGYAPTMGIIGTVMGLISTLAATGSDPTVLIKNIATAFIATMWGIFTANLILLPISDRLRSLHNEEAQLSEVIFEGVRSVVLADNPSVIRARLMSAFPIEQQYKLLSKYELSDKENDSGNANDLTNQFGKEE